MSPRSFLHNRKKGKDPASELQSREAGIPPPSASASEDFIKVLQDKNPTTSRFTLTSSASREVPGGDQSSILCWCFL